MPNRGSRFDNFPMQAVPERHGPQFDRFSRQASSPHGPQFDEGFNEYPEEAGDDQFDRRITALLAALRKLPSSVRVELARALEDETAAKTRDVMGDVRKTDEHDLGSGPADPGDLREALKQSILKNSGLWPSVAKTERPGTGHAGTVRDDAGDEVRKALRELNGLDVTKVREPRTPSGSASQSLDRSLQDLREMAGINVTKVSGRRTR